MDSSFSSYSESESFNSRTSSSLSINSSFPLCNNEIKEPNEFLLNIQSLYQSKDKVMSLDSFPEYSNDLPLNETFSKNTSNIYINSLFNVQKLEKF